MLLVLVVASSTLTPLWTRSQGVLLANHPLVVQLGCGQLPMGCFSRCLLARSVIIEGMETAVAACSGSAMSPDGAELLALLADESARCTRDNADWLANAASAGKTIDLPETEAESGVRCYSCGGTHYNIDCPDDRTAPPEAQALASYIGSATSLAAASSVLHDVSFVASTLLKAGLDGGDAYSPCIRAHAERFEALVGACDRALATSDAVKTALTAAASTESTTAQQLLYAWVDSESGTSGLKETGAEGGLSLQEARERIDGVEPGFLRSQDRNEQFLRTTVLGAPSDAPDAAPTAQERQAARVDAAAAYLQAKQASQQPVGKEAAAAVQDSKAALLASKVGPKQAAAQQYLALRKKQQAAEAYLAKRKPSGDS